MFAHYSWKSNIKFHSFPAEQFEEARKLKYIIDELSKESEAFCKFELDKREAVRKENYDAAQKIKVHELFNKTLARDLVDFRPLYERDFYPLTKFTK